jgi:undecaprenyl diphosphate synthase
MDGNGRWAQRQGLPRVEGHRKGVESVRTIVEESARIGIEQLTLYCLSSENWKRPSAELDFLMYLLEQYMVEERPTIMHNDIRVSTIGRREGIPTSVQAEMDETIAMSRGNKGMRLCLAINYGGRTELIDAVKNIAQEVQKGNLKAEQITESVINQRLYTTGMTDPDLLIRTAGEMRISNFLLWQLAYTELYFDDCLWPDFDTASLGKALQWYAGRERRFGRTSEQIEHA